VIKYNLHVSSKKTKAVTFVRVEPVRGEIHLGRKTIEQVCTL